MTERWIGIAVSGEKITLVDADVEQDDGPIAINADFTWTLQVGDRPRAYDVVHRQLADYLTDNSIDRVVVKASALSLGGTKKGHLDAAELRGVILCAAAAVCEVTMLAKAKISRSYGKRKVPRRRQLLGGERRRRPPS